MVDLKFKPVELFRNWFYSDFPSANQELFKYALDDSGNQPYLYDVYFVALDWYRVPTESWSEKPYQELHVAMCYLFAYIFCLDKLIDDQHAKSEKRLSNIALSSAIFCFLSGAQIRLKRAAELFELPPNIFTDCLSKYMVEHFAALNDEVLAQSPPFNQQTLDEYQSIVGRSNAILFLYESISISCSLSFPNSLKKLLEDFLYYRQIGDDVVDWEEDFHVGRYTGFIRENSSELYVTKESIEMAVYCDGGFERSISNVVNGINSVLKELVVLGREDSILAKYVKSERDVAFNALHNFIIAKDEAVKKVSL